MKPRIKRRCRRRMQKTRRMRKSIMKIRTRTKVNRRHKRVEDDYDEERKKENLTGLTNKPLGGATLGCLPHGIVRDVDEHTLPVSAGWLGCVKLAVLHVLAYRRTHCASNFFQNIHSVRLCHRNNRRSGFKLQH